MQDKKTTVLNDLLSQIEQKIPLKDKSNPTISKANVGWQLDHTLKVINRVCESLKRSNPNDYKKDFNVMRRVLLTLCYIPRGRVKAPKIVRSPDMVSIAQLQDQLNEARIQVNSIESLDKNAHFKHFIFGTLPKAKTLRFLEMHTKHHLKIVKDIMKS
ncbi:DinB family protein [Flavivirga algicola]|uniref:DinB family protein n=1 Tax=Flavivirga algicola TaxID=2729136 RepID=A0ABX1RTU6_9FLAO|nr:DUF1569 domain-containing protein [Flavivirga algicola]NMH86971.1 DinB family protein [Flavivirga algicola]